MNPEKFFTQAGRLFHFTFGGKQVACNYYFTRVNHNSPNQKLWMNILFHFGERKEVIEITLEQPEHMLLLKPKIAQDQKVQRLVETYLTHFM
jgi:hypothetical protein